MKKRILMWVLVLVISFSGISGSVSASSESTLPSNEAGYTVSTETGTPQAPNPDEPDLPNPDDPMTLPETGSLENGGERPQGPFPPEKEIN